MNPTPTEKHRNFYTGIAGQYHDLRYGGRYGRLFRALHHEVLGELLASVSPGARVLEVACGTGHTTELLHRMGVSFIACDLTPRMLERARQRLSGPAPFLIADATRLPFPAGQFDAVISTRFLHLFPVGDQQRILAEMVRVLRPGGRLIVDFDNLVSRWVLAVPHLFYNLIRYQRFAPETVYNRIGQVEGMLAAMGLSDLRSIGIGGYHLILPALLSSQLAMNLGRAHRHRPARAFAEQFVTTGIKGG